MTKDVYIKCSCSSNDHVTAFRLVDYKADIHPDVSLYLNVQMQHSRRFFPRLWIALKYIFKGSPCGYGHWNETIIEPLQATQIIDVCEEFLSKSIVR